MDQAELELQLKVWKDLAISKQILMSAATDALGLDPDCTPEKLKEALDKTIKQGINADIIVSEAREKANQAEAVMEKKMAANDKALAAAEAIKAGAMASQQKSEQDMAVERAAHIQEMKKIKAQISDKESALKAVKKALGDSPENVLKKLKTLKKQKDDEAATRKLVEASVTTLRKEKRKLEQSVTEMKDALENGKKLAEQYRELHAKASEEMSDIAAMDESLLESIEKAVEAAEKILSAA